MKKALLGVSLLTTLFSTASFAAGTGEYDYSGFRAGVGYADTDITLEEDDASASSDAEGFKIEVGYDFNRVIGVIGSYEMVNDSLGNITNDTDTDGSSIKLGADFGYAFYSKEAFLKPHVNVGLVAFSSDDYDEQSIYGGLGLRFQYHNFYTDLSVDAYYLDDADGDDYYKFVQSAWTVGYKF